MQFLANFFSKELSNKELKIGQAILANNMGEMSSPGIRIYSNFRNLILEYWHWDGQKEQGDRLVLSGTHLHTETCPRTEMALWSCLDKCLSLLQKHVKPLSPTKHISVAEE